MSQQRTYWSGSRFVVEWTLTDPDGAPITGASVTGTVTQPTLGAASMTTTATGNVYTSFLDTAEAGRHAYRLEAAGTGVDATEGTFLVRRSLVGLPPITVDPTTSIGKVRLLISDVDEQTPLLEDAQIAAFLAMEGESVKLAAAAALEAIARSETLITKKISTQDLSVDGPAVAAELRASAKLLRDQAPQDTATVTGSALLPVYSFPDPPVHGDWLL